MANGQFNIQLTDDHRQVIERNLQRLDRLEPAFDQVEACGIGCQERREHARAMREFFESVQSAFFAEQ